MKNPDDRPPNQETRTTPLFGADRSMDSALRFEGPALFAVDSVIAERFRIVRLLGRGGMGEVYEAEDLELKERVALKTVLPQIAGDERSMERFRQEILLARKVTHPNVCRTFDVFRHRIASPAVPSQTSEIVFLTMELLAGETLAERLRRNGRMSTSEAFPIIAQIAAALEAAHRAGVVHRDLKSSNVILVPVKEGEAEVRAVVTDFGLARASAAAGQLGPSLTGSEESVGTPLYMAPEQVEDGEITAATDIYALGIVIYEMVTGTWPFVADTRLATASKRLKEDAPSPRVYVPDLDRRWEGVILRCLERDPADRLASASEVVEALAGKEGVSVGWTRARKRQLRNRIAIAALALGAFAASYGGFLFFRDAPLTPRLRGNPSVAVLQFKNLSPTDEDAWVSIALAERLTRELAAGGDLRVIPRDDVARMATELGLQASESLDPATLGRVRANVGADYVVLGSYRTMGKDSGDQVTVDLRLEDANSGSTLASLSEQGSSSKLVELTSRAGARLRQTLGLGEISAAAKASTAAAFPAVTQAERLYAEGITRLQSFDPLTARDFLQQSVATDPNSPLPHAALAEAWAMMGYDVKAQQAAKRASERSAGLTPKEELSAKCRYLELSADWENAINACRALSKASPSDIELGLRYARVQASAGKGQDSLATLADLRNQLQPPAKDDPRIDLQEAEAARTLADYKRQQEAAARAADKAKKQGAVLLRARGRLWECMALQHLDTLDDAWKACEDAHDLYRVGGDGVGQARALSNIGHILEKQGKTAEARAKHEESGKKAQAVGSRLDQAHALMNLANMLFKEGTLARASAKYKEALAIAREIDNKDTAARVLLNIGLVLLAQGEFSGAAKTLEESLTGFREVGNRGDEARARSNLGMLYWEQGSPLTARPHLGAAADIRRDLGLQSDLELTLGPLGEVLLAQAEFGASERAFREALAIQTRLSEGQPGMRSAAALSRVLLAEVALEQGRPTEAEAAVRAAIPQLHEQEDSANASFARRVLARALLAQGKVKEAQQEVERTASLGQKSGDTPTRLAAAISVARVSTAAGRYTEAAKNLNAVLVEAIKAGMVRYQLEARLALGEIEMKSGKTTAGRARLAALEKEARNKGFELIARKAVTGRG